MPLLNMTAETALTPCRRNFFAFIALFFLILIPYANTFEASWHFDDINNIVENKPLHLTELTLENIKKTFFASWDGRGKLYRPVACLSFSLNYYLGGTAVTGYHIVNMAIHFLAACFLFLFIHDTLNLPILKGRYRSNAYFIALLSTVLWAINPVQTQAITYVVQRMTSMAGLWCIMAMFFFLKAKTSTDKKIKTAFHVCCCICWLLALGSKENAIMLPVVLLVYDLFLIRGIIKGNVKRYTFFLFMVLAICIIFALVLAGPSIFNPKNLASGYQNRDFTLFQRLLTEPRVILFYISLLLYPMPDRLCLEHDITISTGFFTPASTSVSILAILMILGLAAAMAKKRPFISFCILFFFLNHLVESSLLPLELVFEHRNYFPSMLFFAPVTILLSMVISHFSGKPLFQWFIMGFVVLILIGWGHSAYIRNRVWQNDETLWGDCAVKYPELARPHHNLGAYYGKKDMPQNAVSEYLMALNRENKNNLVARNWTYYNLGTVYQKLGRDKEALSYYDQAQKYQPGFVPTLIQKGVLLIKKGQYEEAISAFEKVTESDPDNVAAYGNLGFLFLLTGNTQKAIANLNRVSAKDPENSIAMRHLGIAYSLMGDGKKAFIQFTKALSHDGNDPFSLLNLAALYEEKGMNKRKNEVMTRFLAVFKGSDIKLKMFVDSLAPKPGAGEAFVSHRNKLLAVLGNACAGQAEAYGRLADQCLYKKGEPTQKPAHLSDKN